MKKRISILMAVLLCGIGGLARAADTPDANATLTRAIKALGGEEQLGKVKIASWKGKTTTTFGGNDNEGASRTVMQGLNHFRQELEFERNGSTVKIISLLADEKGIRAFGDNRQTMEKEAVANMKRTVYLTAIPITLLPLKDKDFKLEGIGDETIDGKPAVGIKVIAPDHKDFKLYFDKETGLPVREIAKIVGFQAGEEVTQETTYSDYKEVGGIKKAMKVVVKRNGEKFQEQKITEFKILDKADPGTFTDL